MGARTARHEFEVVVNQQAAEGIWRLIVLSDVAAALQPGQFMELSVPGDSSHLLRIPLSFKEADPEKGTVELLYAVVGEGTRRLASMASGDRSDLLGPCGRGWRLPRQAGRALLVAGGIGLPPILAAARMLAAEGLCFDAAIGARTRPMHVFPDVDELLRYGNVRLGERGFEGGYDPDRAVVLTVDVGEGRGGFATDAMEELMGERDYAQVYACGPIPMMATAARIAGARGVACQVSLERMMGCGFGACSCCNVALAQGGYALCCQDGPVFDAEEVAW